MAETTGPGPLSEPQASEFRSPERLALGSGHPSDSGVATFVTIFDMKVAAGHFPYNHGCIPNSYCFCVYLKGQLPSGTAVLFQIRLLYLPNDYQVGSVPSQHTLETLAG